MQKNTETILVVGGLAVAGYLIYKSQIAKGIGEVASGVGTGVMGIGEGVGSAFSGVGGAVGMTAQDLEGFIRNAVGNANQIVGGVAGTVVAGTNQAQNLVNTTGGAINTSVGNIGAVAGNTTGIFADASSFLRSGVNSLFNFAQNPLASVGGLFGLSSTAATQSSFNIQAAVSKPQPQPTPASIQIVGSSGSGGGGGSSYVVAQSTSGKTVIGTPVYNSSTGKMSGVVVQTQYGGQSVATKSSSLRK